MLGEGEFDALSLSLAVVVTETEELPLIDADGDEVVVTELVAEGHNPETELHVAPLPMYSVGRTEQLNI